jgi:hypothetical protein
MVLPKTQTEQSVALLTGVSLAVFEARLGLLIGLIATFVLVGRSRGEPAAQEKTP